VSDEIEGTMVVPFLVQKPWEPDEEPAILPVQVRLPDESTLQPVEEEPPASVRVVAEAARLKVAAVVSKSPPLTFTSPEKRPLPITWSFSVGEVVPTPKLPLALISIPEVADPAVVKAT
jgi:hypothetical protein